MTEPDAVPQEEIRPQDTFRKVYLGQVSDPLVPPPACPLEPLEDELTRLALEDPMALEPPPEGRPTVWRLVGLITFAVLALGIVFWFKG